MANVIELHHLFPDLLALLVILSNSFQIEPYYLIKKIQSFISFLCNGIRNNHFYFSLLLLIPVWFRLIIATSVLLTAMDELFDRIAVIKQCLLKLLSLLHFKKEISHTNLLLIAGDSSDQAHTILHQMNEIASIDPNWKGVTPMITAVIHRKWKELATSKNLLILNLLLPALPFLLFILSSSFQIDQYNLIEKIQTSSPLLQNETYESLNARLYFSLFLLIPAMLPLTFATSSIIMEKINNSLEAILVTPILTSQLLLGKILAYVIPATLITWLMQLLFSIFFLLPLTETFSLIAFLTHFLLVPLLALVSVGLGMIVSTRSKNLQTAQQVGVVLVLPVLGMAVGQFFALHLLQNDWIFYLLLSIVAILAILVIRISISLFQRESIMSHWRK